MSGLLPVDEALRRILAGASKLETEAAFLGEAGGRVLAADLHAKRQQPPLPLQPWMVMRFGPLMWQMCLPL